MENSGHRFHTDSPTLLRNKSAADFLEPLCENIKRTVIGNCQAVDTGASDIGPKQPSQSFRRMRLAFPASEGLREAAISRLPALSLISSRTPMTSDPTRRAALPSASWQAPQALTSRLQLPQPLDGIT